MAQPRKGNPSGEGGEYQPCELPLHALHRRFRKLGISLQQKRDCGRPVQRLDYEGRNGGHLLGKGRAQHVAALVELGCGQHRRAADDGRLLHAGEKDVARDFLLVIAEVLQEESCLEGELGKPYLRGGAGAKREGKQPRHAVGMDALRLVGGVHKDDLDPVAAVLERGVAADLPT